MRIHQRIHAFFWTSMTANNCNTYLIDGPPRVLIDPGLSRHFEHVTRGLEELGLATADIDVVLATHAHPDHIEAVKFFKNGHTLFAIHETEWAAAMEMLKYFGPHVGEGFKALSPDLFLREGDLQLKDLEVQVLHVPGHSPGSIALYLPADQALFTGDLIFKEGLGRTDLPGGDGKALKSSVARLLDLDVEWLLPGHGDMIQGADEVRENAQQIQQFYLRYI